MKIRNMCTLPLRFFFGGVKLVKLGQLEICWTWKMKTRFCKRNLGWIVFPNFCCLTHPLMVLHLGNNDDKKHIFHFASWRIHICQCQRIWIQSISIHFWEVNMEKTSTSKFKNKKEPPKKNVKKNKTHNWKSKNKKHTKKNKKTTKTPSKIRNVSYLFPAPPPRLVCLLSCHFSAGTRSLWHATGLTLGSQQGGVLMSSFKNP